MSSSSGSLSGSHSGADESDGDEPELATRALFWEAVRGLPTGDVRRAAPRDLADAVSQRTGFGPLIDSSPRGLHSLVDSRSVLGRVAPARLGALLLPQHPRRVASLQRSQLFVAKYSHDGAAVACASQDGRISIYDTNNNHRLARTVNARDIGWSILDCAYAPNGQWLAYSSWSPDVHLVNATGDVETHEAIPVSRDDGGGHFGLFSAQFSLSSTHLLCGANDGRVHLVDLASSAVSERFSGHADDVNCVGISKLDPNLFFTASDDCRVGVFDRRLGAAAGWLEGHTEGVTSVDASPSDANYIVSNGKDQSARLWDIRRCTARSPWAKRNRWDYRSASMVNCNRGSHPNDVSVQRYVGHAVLITLIRCALSPALSGSRYLVSGSACGRVHVWDVLSGTLLHRLPSHQSIVREVGWHPLAPELTSVSFDGLVLNWSTNAPVRRRRAECGE